MRSLLSLPLLTLLAACGIFNTPADKAAEPAKDKNSGDAGSGNGQDGRQTDGKTSQGTVDKGDGGDSTLYVVNDSDYNVCWIYADGCDGSQSDDLLGDYMLPPGYYLEVTGVPADCYDLWAFDCDETGIWNYEADISGEFTWFLTSYGDDDGGDDTGGGGWDTSW